MCATICVDQRAASRILGDSWASNVLKFAGASISNAAHQEDLDHHGDDEAGAHQTCAHDAGRRDLGIETIAPVPDDEADARDKGRQEHEEHRAMVPPDARRRHFIT